MLVKGQNIMSFIEIKEKISKKDTPYQLISFGDPINFQRLEFFLPRELSVQGLQPGQRCTLDLNITQEGFNTRVELVKINTAKPAAN